MKSSDKRPPVPPVRVRTLRRQVIDCLRGGPATIGTLSREIGLPQKQVRDQLASLQGQVTLLVTPARCNSCGFEFKGRRRIGKPGRCPKCRGTYISEPFYSIGGE